MFQLIPHNPPSTTPLLARAPPYKTATKAEKLRNAAHYRHQITLTDLLSDVCQYHVLSGAVFQTLGLK